MTAVLPQDLEPSEIDIASLPDGPSILFDKSTLGHLPPNEQRLFEAFGQGPVQALPYRLIHDAVAAQAASQPEAVAIDHLGKTIGYGELNRRADRLACLLASMGVGRGDNVALFLRRSIELVIGQLATMKLGAAYVPQHVGVAPASQLRHILDVTGAPSC